MNDVDKLRLMDPYEVHSKTYITPKILRRLLEGEYEKFDSKTNALGLVKVLERELELDLTDLKREIERFFNDPINQELIQKRQKERNIRISELEKSQHEQTSTPFYRILKILATVIVIFVLVDIYIVYFAHKGNISDLLPHNLMNSATHNEKEIQKSPNTPLTAHAASQKSIAKSSSSTMQYATTQHKKQENLTQSPTQEHSLTSYAPKAKESSNTEQTAQISQYKALIKPLKKVWIGIVYLDNGQKVMMTTQEPIELNLSRDQLIMLGHGFFDLNVDGKVQHFSSASTQRLMIKDGNIQFIDKETFKKHNKGRNW